MFKRGRILSICDMYSYLHIFGKKITTNLKLILRGTYIKWKFRKSLRERKRRGKRRETNGVKKQEKNFKWEKK
jgi:hypothetical protein